MLTSKLKTSQLSSKQAQDDRKWHIVDVAGLNIGRAATQVAQLLRGKHKPSFTPHVDCGDFVVVINSNKVSLSGSKMEGKLYYRHTLFPGGLKSRTAQEMIQSRPEEMIYRAVWGMLPKGPLGRVIIKKLKIYAGDKHPHLAQQPKVHKLETMRKHIQPNQSK